MLCRPSSPRLVPNSQITPDDLKALNGLGSLHGAQQQFEKSEEYFRFVAMRGATGATREFWWAVLLTRLLPAVHDRRTALSSCRRLLEIDPSNVEGHFNYGTLLVHMGRLVCGKCVWVCDWKHDL